MASLIDTEGKLVDDSKGKADILNKQFTSVFSKISPLTLSQTSAQAFRKLPNFSQQGSQNYNSSYASMPEIEISTRGVAKLLEDLKPHNAAGPDSIRPIILKTLHKEISPMLTFLFQKIFIITIR